MKPKFFLHSLILGLLFLLISVGNNSLFAQARLVINNTSAVYMRMNGGTKTIPIYLVVDNAATNAITCGSAGAVCPASGSLSWIISEGQYNYVKWRQVLATTNVVPFGSLVASNYYLPVTIAKSTGAADLTVSTWGTAASNNLPWADISDDIFGTPTAAVTNMTCPSLGSGVDGSAQAVVDRWWDIYSGGVAATANITLNYMGAENTLQAGDNSATASLQHWTGTEWNNGQGGAYGTVTTEVSSTALTTGAGPHAVTFNGITQYTPFVIGSGGIHPLPVTWLSVSSECVGMDVVIRWSTASEENADFFTVERSSDGAPFDPIKNVRASGNSSTVKNYSAVDPDPLSGITYYRIRETDFNGESFLSKQITSNGCSSDISISVYPNPALPTSGLNMVVSGAKDAEVLIVVTDMLGREFYSKVVVIEDDQQTIAIDPTHQLAAGVYTVVASSNDNIQKRKIVVQ